MMEIKYQVSEADYLQFNIFHTMRTPAYKRLLLFSHLVGPMASLVVLFIMWRTLDNFSEFPLFLLVLVPLVIVSIIFFVRAPKTAEKNITRSLKKMIKEQQVDEFVGPYTLTLLEDRMRGVNPRNTTEVAYGNIEKIEYDQTQLYLYCGSITAYIIPYSAFPDQLAMDQFLSFLAEKMAA